MKIQATVIDVSLDSYEKDGVKRESNLHLLVEAGEPGTNLKQILEYSRPKNEAPFVIGQRVNVQISEIQNIYMGRLRFRGSVTLVK